MEYARLATAKLNDVDDTYYFGASCGSCKHSSRLSLTKLREQLGGDFALIDIRPRLKCECCGGREIVVSFLTPDSRRSNLVQLWQVKPR